MSINLIGPDGREAHIESDDPAVLAKAKELGYRELTEATPQTMGEALHGAVTEAKEVGRAALHGGLKGLTAGLYNAGNDVEGQDEQAVDEAHPIAHGIGEVAGMLTSPVNLLAPEVEGARAATVLGRVGQKALSGAAIGGLYGAGSTISDAALGDSQLTAEKLIAGAGLGALLGGLGGGMGGAVEEGAAKVLPKLATVLKGGQSMLDDVADDAAISATRAQQGVINRLGDDKIRAVAGVLRSRGHLQMSPEAMAESIAKDREGVGKLLGKFLDDADAAGSKVDHMRMLNRLDQFESGLNPLERDAVASDLRAARKAVAELGEQGSGFRALDDLKQTLQAKAKFSRGPTPLDDTTLGLKRGLAGVFRDELDQQLLPQIGSDAAKSFTESKALYGSLRDAERLAESGASRVGGRGALAYVGLKDLLAGNLVSGGGHAFGIAGAVGAKFIREQGPAIIARVADKLAKSPALQAVAQSFSKALPTVAPKLGAYGPALLLAAKRAPALALAQHMVTAQVDPEYAASARLAGLQPESPDEHVAALGRATSLAATQATLQAHDRAISEAFDHIAAGTKPPAGPDVRKTQDFGAKRMRQESQEAFRRRVDEVRRLAVDPQALIDRTSGNLEALGHVAPGLTAAMTATAQRAVQYLASQAEMPAKPGPLARDWVPTATQRHAFTLKLEAVQEPMSVLRSAARGMLVKPQLDAVRAVYPEFAKAIENHALERMASGEQMSYRARLMLSMLTGVSADGTTRPASIAANQQAIATAAGKPSEQMGTASEGLQKLGDANRMATPGQRRELEKPA